MSMSCDERGYDDDVEETLREEGLEEELVATRRFLRERDNPDDGREHLPVEIRITDEVKERAVL